MVSPADTLLRRQHWLRRQKYKSCGPNWDWHVDGHDKPSPWGLCISGVIDGFSRKIMFLEVGPTNHDPWIISTNYLNTIKEIGGCPQIIQTDCGTENLILAAQQVLFCTQSTDAVEINNHHRYSSSQTNQCIECWWSQLRNYKHLILVIMK